MIVLSSLAYLSVAIAAIVVTITILNLPKDENGNKIWPSVESNNVSVSTPKEVIRPPQAPKTTFVASNSTMKDVNFYDKESSDNEFERNGATLKTIIKLDGVSFKDNTLVLANASYARLRVAVVALNKFSKFSILVAVHTNSEGDSEDNKILSQDQAKTVKEYFVNQGIKPSRLGSIGFGDEQPIADSSTEEGLLSNQRVELRIY